MTRVSNDHTRVTPDDPAYLELAAAEARYWQDHSVGFLEGIEDRGGDSIIERYTNERFTHDATTPWYGTIPRSGDYKRALFLGTSGMAQDAYLLANIPDMRVTICDISAGSLERWQQVLGAKFPGRIDILVADLNFAEFEENAYDLVVSSSTLHHVINLEHVGAQINRALTPDGRFFLQDYVGETLFRFSDTKKRIFEDLYNRDIARTKGRKPGLIWTNEDPTQRSPFCGIRSGDILNVMAGELNEVDRRTAGMMTGLLIYASPADGTKVSLSARAIAKAKRIALKALGRPSTSSFLSEPYARDLLLVDQVLCDAGTFLPFNGFITYGKRH